MVDLSCHKFLHVSDLYQSDRTADWSSGRLLKYLALDNWPGKQMTWNCLANTLSSGTYCPKIFCHGSTGTRIGPGIYGQGKQIILKIPNYGMSLIQVYFTNDHKRKYLSNIEIRINRIAGNHFRGSRKAEKCYSTQNKTLKDNNVLPIVFISFTPNSSSVWRWLWVQCLWACLPTNLCEPSWSGRLPHQSLCRDLSMSRRNGSWWW